MINADDYFLIDQAFLGQGQPLGAAAGSVSLSSIPVPEPTSFIPLAGLLITLRRPRNR
jgi:hypothetical protein